MYDRTVRAIGCIPTLHKKEVSYLDKISEICEFSIMSLNFTFALSDLFLNSYQDLSSSSGPRDN